MKADTTYLRALNAEYRTWTGEDLYLHTSHPTPNTTRYTFVSGVMPSLNGAEGYMRWALEALRTGRHTHGELVHITPTEKTQA